MDILASARPSKQLPEKKSGKKQKKDPNVPTNPKHKYHQKARVKGHGQSPLVETSHKQMSPMFLTSASAPRGQENLLAPMPGEPSEELAVVEEDREVEAVDEGREDGGEREEEREEEEEEEKERGERTEEGKEMEREEETEGIKEEEREERTESREEGAEEEEGVEEKGHGDVPREATVPEGCPQLEDRDSADQLVPKETLSPDQSLSGSTHSAGGAESVAAAAELGSGGGEQEEEGEDSDEEKKAVLVEENIQLLEESEKDQLSALDSFTGYPVSEDILLYAIPVSTPYAAIISYKYRVKLVPGTNKRGKAARAAVHRFIQSREASQREKDLLKSVKDNDLSRYIPGKVKMALPQAHKQSHR